MADKIGDIITEVSRFSSVGETQEFPRTTASEYWPKIDLLNQCGNLVHN